MRLLIRGNAVGSTEIENVRMDFPFIVFLSNLHISVIRLSMITFFYEEGVTLCLLDILFTLL